MLYTQNTADFRRLDAAFRTAERHHAGIIILNDQRTPIATRLRSFQSVAAKFAPEDTADRLEFLLNHA